jgi:fructokinase
VAAAVARLGGESYFIGQVGNDPFGHYLKAVLQAEGVRTDHLRFTSRAHTALAFVSLRADGERDFLFYRDPSADQVYKPDSVKPHWFEDAPLFHCGSLLLTHPTSEAATWRALELARRAGSLVSIDANLRLSLWPGPNTAREKISRLLEGADIIKLSEEELVFLSQQPAEEVAARRLLDRGSRLVVVTRGGAGCGYYTANLTGSVSSLPVLTVDATGAGDAFVGGLLYQIASADGGPAGLNRVLDNPRLLENMLRFANACGAITTTRRGAIPALPDRRQVEAMLGG